MMAIYNNARLTPLVASVINVVCPLFHLFHRRTENRNVSEDFGGVFAPKRGADRIRAQVFAICAILGIVTSPLLYAKPMENAVNIQRYDISPDGTLMLFEFVHPKRGVQTALYDWRKEKLTVLQATVPEAGNGPFVHARFTPDGKSLLALSVLKLSADPFGAYDAHLVKIGIADQSVTHLARLPLIERLRSDPSKGRASYEYWTHPTLQPGTSKVLFVIRFYAHYFLREFDLATGQVRTILDKKDGFSSLIAEPYFVGPDEVIFMGINPFNAELKKQAESIGLNRSELASYQFKFGEPMKLIFPRNKTESERLITARSASLDGKTMMITGLSQVEPYNERRQYNIELFTVNNGQLKQHTHMRSHMGGARMAANGSTAIFAARFDREGPRDVGHEFYAIDLGTDQVTHLRVLELLRQHVEQTNQ